MSTSTTSQPAGGGVRVNGHSLWVWALRRTFFGIVILTVTIVGAAWLYYVAIDTEAEASAGQSQSVAVKVPGKSATAAH